MSYEDAYTKLIYSTLTSLEAIESPDGVNPFVAQTATQVGELSTKIPEFYVEEFFNILKDAVVERFRIETADCERALRDANAEAAAASDELQARLDAARAAGDRETEHAVWRDREMRQAACQAKVDAASRRADILSLRLSAFQELPSALGINFD
jgi:hypothetical protein